MATTDVDICNAALVLIGKPAVISSLTDGSVAASNCQALYSLSLSTLLAEFAWTFATTTVLLANVDNPNQLWQYAYQLPGDVVTPLDIYESDAQGDITGTFSNAYPAPLGLVSFYPTFSPGMQLATQQDFTCETDSEGNGLILTNQANAMLKYVRFVTSAANFPPLFVQALSCMLASKLAGAMIKGDVGVTAVEKLLQTYTFWLDKAKVADANRRVEHPRYVPAALAMRNGA
ncbi:hypothetical protein [Methylomonas sp. AM2-LC]|uniref:hypothetical protein n=1 Tax=Methylomonas sp. AM2-LC TaxID=3153301 RepID=UPI003265CB26